MDNPEPNPHTYKDAENIQQSKDSLFNNGVGETIYPHKYMTWQFHH